MISASLVLYHNKQSDVDKVIDSVLKSEIDCLYIVDHSSGDAFKTLEAVSDRIRYVHTENDGYGKGHNIGFKLTQRVITSDYHIVLNPDIYFEPSAIEVLADYMDKNKDVGLVMPKVFYPNGDFQYLCKLLPTPSDILLRQFAPTKIKEKNDRRYTLKDANYERIMKVPSLSGCFMFLRTKIFDAVGGFDTRFFMHFEDVDLTRRIGDMCNTVYIPMTSIIHAHAAAHKHNRKMLIIGLKSAVKYFNKWGWLFDKTRRIRNREAINDYCLDND